MCVVVYLSVSAGGRETLSKLWLSAPLASFSSPLSHPPSSMTVSGFWWSIPFGFISSSEHIS